MGKLRHMLTDHTLAPGCRPLLAGFSLHKNRPHRSHTPKEARSLTWAAQMLYCVNMASYKAISPLCPAAAQARASKTGIACNTPIRQYVVGKEGRPEDFGDRVREAALTNSFSWFCPECRACRTL